MPERDERSVGRGLLILILSGTILGAAYNQLALNGRPPRGLPWRASAAAFVPVEAMLRDSLPAPATAPAETSAARPPAASAPAVAPHTAAPRGAPKPAPRASAPVQATAAIPEHAAPMEAGLETVKRLFETGGAQFVDAREADEFEAGHIPGAVRLTYNDVLVDPARLAPLRADGRPIVAYCDGGTCEASSELAKLLSESGFRRVLVFTGGWPEWNAAGEPAERGAK